MGALLLLTLAVGVGLSALVRLAVLGLSGS